ncbi:hypothetical protein [Paenibacillus luteus]|nr:hypothetical protein [Paenibacillus luteus]
MDTQEVHLESSPVTSIQTYAIWIPNKTKDSYQQQHELQLDSIM